MAVLKSSMRLCKRVMLLSSTVRTRNSSLGNTTSFPADHSPSTPGVVEDPGMTLDDNPGITGVGRTVPNELICPSTPIALKKRIKKEVFHIELTF